MIQQKVIQKKQESRPKIARQPGRSQISARMQDRKYLGTQGIIGNHGMLRRYGSDVVQTKLTVSSPKTQPTAHISAASGKGISTTRRGLKPSATEDEVLRGRTVGESIGDVARPVGTFLGNVFGWIAGAVTGISISSSTNTGPTWNNHGAFDWQVGFNTTGRNGWIIQEVVNTWRAEDATGTAIGNPFTPHYWEAWAVDGAGNVTPSIGATNDFWTNPNFNATLSAVEGHWATTGHLYFTATDPATVGFVANNPATNAGILLSTTSAPSGLGIARLHRYAQGTWDSTGATPTHTGSAGP